MAENGPARPQRLIIRMGHNDSDRQRAITIH